MIHSLKIQNLILIEKAEIPFTEGLNILTGETGAGKSAILEAIRLISGERAETQMIRSGAAFAIVEAKLEGDVHIRRELYRSGKNRCFIDDLQVSLAELKEFIRIERVDQSSSSALFSREMQCKMLDLYADLTEEAMNLAQKRSLQSNYETKLQTLLQIPKDRELEWAQKDLTAIEEADWQPITEEKLTAEHHVLSHAATLFSQLGSIKSALTEGIPLKRLSSILEQCARLDESIKPIAASMKSASLELEEAEKELGSYLSRLEVDPSRLAAVETQISAIETLKRRFGADPELAKNKLSSQIERLLKLDEDIKTLQSKLTALSEENKKNAEELYRKRKLAAVPFAAKIVDELKSLNLPFVQFQIDFDPEVQFLFTANPGTESLPIEACCSGGELSRLLLAIKTILADKENSACIVFDEIDSNVGGQTAAILGEKLQGLAKKRQVICVTHFVQVASCALNHLLVTKNEKNGLAYTSVEQLTEKTRQQEYNRMLGNK